MESVDLSRFEWTLGVDQDVRVCVVWDILPRWCGEGLWWSALLTGGGVEG